MNRIAFIIGDKFLYWNAIILTLAVLSAVCMFFALAVRNPEDRKTAVILVPLAFAFSLILSRLVHWYCRPQGYGNLTSALLDYSRGSFALIGVFAGCLLAAIVLRLCRVSRNLPGLLDEMCISGALGIAVGRLGALFTASDRGLIVADWVPFPLASRLINSVSGETEVRLAVFMIQSFIAAVLFFVLLCTFLSKNKSGKRKDGDVCLTFLLWYCGSQAVLDSPRYDSLYFRSNGFVSIVQIFSVITILTVLVIFTVRLCRAGQVRKIWLMFLAIPFLGLAGYMEYHVQRHGGEALFAYSVMSASMLTAVILILRIRANAVPKIHFTGNDGYDRPAAYADPREYEDYQTFEEQVGFNRFLENCDPEYSQFSQNGDREKNTKAPAERSKNTGSSRHYKGRFSAR